jgi:dipeptidyl aminopeptidase/acylaminoacyl peptidase
MFSKRGFVIVVFSFVLACSSSAQTRPSIDSVFDALHSLSTFSTVAISPDGSRVAWVQNIDDSPELRRSAIWVAAAGGAGKPARITAARDGKSHRERDVAWSPDGKSIAFLSDADQEPQLEIYVASASGGAARRVTGVSGQLEHLAWSPDGRSIAFLFIEGSTQEPGALVPYKLDSGLVEEKVEEQRIAIADAATGQVRSVSPANLYVYEYDWSSDGKTFAATGAEGSGTNNYWIAQLYTIRADGGATRSIWKPQLQIASPRWSPNGRSIAVIHGLMSDFGLTGGDIWLVPADGGEARNLTPGIRSSANALFFRADDEILFSELVDGELGIATIDPGSGKTATLWSGPQDIHLSVARKGTASAVVRSSFESAPAVCAGPIGSWHAITHDNDGAARFWGEGRSLHWQSGETRVQGWLLYPRDFDPKRRYPMIVQVHGGPAAGVMPSWPTRWTATLPSQGYFVFMPNPRGSYGFGEAFTQGNVKDFGHGDLADIQTGIDEALRQAPVDKDRLGLVGWSYGGYMAMWTVTQTNRFKAAVAGAGIVSWQSYYGQNRIDQWMIPYFGKSVYEDPLVYAKSSPITYITQVRTPTLVLHGDRDSEVPTPQGYEFWHALKTLGVPTQLVIYENEGHAIRKPADQKDILRRTVEWFDKYLKKS